jgi:thiamine-phosphate pyrophosphorylase
VKSLSDCRIYGILDLSYVEGANVVPAAKAMIAGGVDLIQLRAKAHSIKQTVDLAKRLHQITSPASVPLIVNDHAEVAAEISVEGIHVGQDDDPVGVARQKAGCAIIVGKSTHSLEQAMAAQDEGADYIGFGPIFVTPTKPDYQPIGLTNIREAHQAVALPIFCIGGIKRENLAEVAAAGARRVAIVSGLLKSPDIAEYARACKKLLSECSSF